MTKILRALLFLMLVVSPAYATTSVVGTINYPNGTPVSGTLQVQLESSTAVMNTCVTPSVNVSKLPFNIPVVNGQVQGGSIAMVTNDCMTPRAMYEVKLIDGQRKVLWDSFWFLTTPVTGSTDVGTLEGTNAGFPLALTVPLPVVQGPGISQTVTQQAGTTFMVTGGGAIVLNTTSGIQVSQLLDSSFLDIAPSTPALPSTGNLRISNQGSGQLVCMDSLGNSCQLAVASTIGVNGTSITSPNFGNLPSPDTNNQLLTFKASGVNVSVETPQATVSQAGVVKLASDLAGTYLLPNVVSLHLPTPTNNAMMKETSGGNVVPGSLQDTGTQTVSAEPHDMSTFPIVFEAANEPATGTAGQTLAKLTPSGAISLTIADTAVQAYIVTGGAGITGSAHLAFGGVANCKMDATNSNTEGWFVFASTSVAADCSASSTVAAGIAVVGTLVSNSTTAGSAASVAPGGIYLAAGGGGGSTITINGGGTVAAPNFGNLPAAGANNQLLVWNYTSGNNVSVQVPIATGSQVGLIELGTDLGNTAAAPQVKSLHLPTPTTNALLKETAGGNAVPGLFQDNGTNTLSTAPHDMVTFPIVTDVANEASTGTTVNKLAKILVAGTAKITATTDLAVQAYVVVAGAGTTGSAQIALSGQASCVMDATNSNTGGWYVSVSSLVAGDCSASAALTPGATVVGLMAASSTTAGSAAQIVVSNATPTQSGGGIVDASLQAGASAGAQIDAACALFSGAPGVVIIPTGTLTVPPLNSLVGIPNNCTVEDLRMIVGPDATAQEGQNLGGGPLIRNRFTAAPSPTSYNLNGSFFYSEPFAGGTNNGSANTVYNTILDEQAARTPGQHNGLNIQMNNYSNGDTNGVEAKITSYGLDNAAGDKGTSALSATAQQGSLVLSATVGGISSNVVTLSSPTNLPTVGVGRYLLTETTNGIWPYSTGTTTSISGTPPVVLGSSSAWGSLCSVPCSPTDLFYVLTADIAGGGQKLVIPIRTVTDATHITLNYAPQGVDAAYPTSNSGAYTIYRGGTIQSIDYSLLNLTLDSAADFTTSDSVESPLAYAHHIGGIRIEVGSVLPAASNGTDTGVHIGNIGSTTIGQAVKVAGNFSTGVVFTGAIGTGLLFSGSVGSGTGPLINVTDTSSAVLTLINTETTGSAARAFAYDRTNDRYLMGPMKIGASSTGIIDSSAASEQKIRNATTLTTSAEGDIGYDLTNHMMHLYNNIGDAVVIAMAASVTPANNDCAKFVKTGSAQFTVTTSGGACGGGGSPGGTNGQIQYNNSGSFGGITLACANAGTCAVGPGTSTASHVALWSGTDGVTLADGTLGGIVGTATNAQLSMTTLGDMIYDNSPSVGRLAGNTSATKKYLSQTGTGLVSAAPAWAQVSFADLSSSIALAQTVLTTQGDLLVVNSTPALARLAIGSTGKALTSNGTTESWNILTSANVDTSIAQTGVDINTSFQVTALHLASPTTNALLKETSGGNAVASSLTDNGTQSASTEPHDMTTLPILMDVGNDNSTGTVVNQLAKLTSTGAIKIGTGDTAVPVYVVQSGAGTSSNAQLVIGGQVACKMDHTDSNTEGWFVVASTTTAADCHAQATQPAAVEVIGYMVSNSTTSGSNATMTANLEFTGTLVDTSNAGNISSGLLALARGGLGVSAASVSAHNVFGNNTGSGTGGAFVQLACGDLSDASAFCNGTSATSLTGTLAAARFPAFTAGDTNGCTTAAAGVVITCGNGIAHTGADISTSYLVTGTNGQALPVSATMLATNGSSQIIAATAPTAQYSWQGSSFMPVSGDFMPVSGQGAQNASSTGLQQIQTFAGKATALYVYDTGTVYSGSDVFTVTLQVNGSTPGSSLTCSLNSTNTSKCSDTTHSVTWNANDTLNYVLTATTPIAAVYSISLGFAHQ